MVEMAKTQLLFSELLAEVSSEKLMEYTKNVAKEVRLSGTEEELRAFQYVKETLETFQLETNLLFNDAYISLPISSELRVNDLKINSITHSMAISTPEAGLEGELVYVGKGSDQDYATVEVESKFVLVDGLAIPGAVKKAQEAGAKGVIFINAEYTHEMIVSPVWGNPTPETFTLMPKIPVSSVNYHDGMAIKEIMEKSGSLKVWLKTEVDTGWRKIPTLIAELKGNVEPDKFVLFSGHIDSWHYGAMDNGSANATMLEVARILSSNRDSLRRTLRFAFWSGHSHGRYAGSAAYCDANWEDFYENCVVHINIDSVGAIGSTILSEGNCMAETKELAGEFIHSITGEVFEGSRFGRAGDQSFWGTGTPSLLMGLSEQPASTTLASQAFSLLFGAGKGGGFGWWWHTTEDTIDKIDPVNLKRDCKIYLAIIQHVTSAKIIPINQLNAINELKNILQDFNEKVGDRLDLSLSISRINELNGRVQELYKFIEETANFTDKEVELINQCLMSLSQTLVPLNYVSGDVFEHDPAMKQSTLPLLSKINEFSHVEPGTNEYHLLKTTLTRKVNKVNFLLKQAINGVEEKKEKIKK
jgi:hypothetical protein